MDLDSPPQRDLVVLVVSRSFEKKTSSSCKVNTTEVLSKDVGALLLGSNELEFDRFALN